MPITVGHVYITSEKKHFEASNNGRVISDVRDQFAH